MRKYTEIDKEWREYKDEIFEQSRRDGLVMMVVTIAIIIAGILLLLS